ncbi:MAG TPA: thioredoxin domain-containing protein [Verrucomicrobiae bacterium]|nr:thioredoxin domain-containing protein [Verrucomicrobiae bacterium]
MMNKTASPASGFRDNRLSKEKSPYLLQHQHNPVDWFAWKPEAFEKARAEDKPIFLSIGYSTCHWCHVMERESFENEEVARFLNEHFVSIKVDREERPDVDKIYMTFVQATTGQGGWPLTAFLTPDLKPFFGGTYFPPDNRYGRPGFLQLLRHIQNLWQTRRADLADSAADIHSQIEQASAQSKPAGLELTSDVLQQAGLRFKQLYDYHNGGFGGAPKFPHPSQPRFLLRYSKQFKDDEAAKMVLNTCRKMADGGIHDQLGGGFARYSVDAEWLVPHFEKMLYDNAQLAQLYLDAFVLSGAPEFAGTARDILDYVLRDMTHPEGGFYSAEDADSEGHEGKFYCWTTAELSRLLSPEEYNVASSYFGITEGGNFVDHSHPKPLAGQNVLSKKQPEVAAADKPLLDSAITKMRAAREKRVRPHLDDKVLSSWNGLMLGAMARAGVVLGEDRYLRAAEKNLRFLQGALWNEAGRKLYHRWREGERDTSQLLQDYAFLLAGTLDLYEATLDPSHLEFSVLLAESLLAGFYDPQNGGFWQSPSGADDLILRMKDDYDGAEPSGSSVATLALLRLGNITDRGEFTAAAEKTLRLSFERLSQMPEAVPYLLQAFDFFLEPPKRAVVAGEHRDAAMRPLLRAVHSVYEPNKVVLGVDGPVEPFTKTLPRNEAPLVYLCAGTSCQPPTREPAEIRTLLETRT